MPETIPYIGPDGLMFAAPETHYSFHQPSHTFIGQNTSFMAPDSMEGLCSIVARFNYAGELEEGSVKIVGRIPSLGIERETLLLQGSILNVDTFGQDGQFMANFFFRIEQDHPLLGYESHFGVWNSYMLMDGWPDFYHRYLFRRTWGPASAGLNSYMGQVKNIV